MSFEDTPPRPPSKPWRRRHAVGDGFEVTIPLQILGVLKVYGEAKVLAKTGCDQAKADASFLAEELGHWFAKEHAKQVDRQDRAKG